MEKRKMGYIYISHTLNFQIHNVKYLLVPEFEQMNGHMIEVEESSDPTMTR